MNHINRFEGVYFFLSNFYVSQVELDGVAYPTVEHAYQAAKTVDVQVRLLIAKAATPGAAKMIGRRAKLRADWEDVKIAVMYSLLQQKFAKGSPLAARLKSTGQAQLVEGNWWGDRFWGVCKGVGENNLGKLLMVLREELFETEEKT